jgi:glucan 1,3-beta-glucosidase
MSSSRPDSLADPFVTAPNTPLNPSQTLEPPRASYLSPTPETIGTPRDSYAQAPENSSPLVPEVEKRNNEAYGQESNGVFLSQKRSLFKRPLFWVIALTAVIIVVLAVVLPVYFVVIKPHNSNYNGSTGGGSSGGGGSGSGSGNPASPAGYTTGGNGSLITTADGTTFTYLNPFGGICKLYHSLPCSGQGCILVCRWWAAVLGVGAPAEAAKHNGHHVFT